MISFCCDIGLQSCKIVLSREKDGKFITYTSLTLKSFDEIVWLLHRHLLAIQFIYCQTQPVFINIVLCYCCSNKALWDQKKLIWMFFCSFQHFFPVCPSYCKLHFVPFVILFAKNEKKTHEHLLNFFSLVFNFKTSTSRIYRMCVVFIQQIFDLLISSQTKISRRLLDK
jgi:hypothetical protein